MSTEGGSQLLMIGTRRLIVCLCPTLLRGSPLGIDERMLKTTRALIAKERHGAVSSSDSDKCCSGAS